MAAGMNRRRFIAISASAAGLALLTPHRAKASLEHAVTWRGRALGAPATLILHHENRAVAERLVARTVTEIARLEAIFSLYQEDSALSGLNRLGAIAIPPPELGELVETAREFWSMTHGAFDPTVQPLWMLYARHFSLPGADRNGPEPGMVNATLELVGFEKVRSDRNRIAFARAGMALTMNGIAQGYITDRIIELLRGGGITSTMVDMGEIRALGQRGDATPWTVEVGRTGGRNGEIIEIADKAIATSSPAGFQFDSAGRFNHLLDPRTGSTAHRWQEVSVMAPDATTADALATAFSLMHTDDITQFLTSRPEIQVRLRNLEGDVIRL